MRVARPSWQRACGIAVTAAFLVAALPRPFHAHEIPARVAVLAFVKPQGETLRVVARVPLESMRDVEWPLRGAGYLDLARAAPLLDEAARLWVADYIEILEDGRPLEAPRIAVVRVSLPSDRSFERWEEAVAHLAAPPLPDVEEIPWQQAMLDVSLEYRITSDRSAFSIHPALAHLGVRTTTVLRFLPPGGGERLFTYEGDPGMVPLDPRWHQASLRFVREGFAHILGGIDHLLFVLCLVIPIRRVRPLLAVVTAFTVAHSITLIAAALGFAPTALWFPPLIEALIALSIVYMALENIVAPKLRRRWLVAFAFGLVHGFGFSFALGESLQFAGRHLVASLVAFNVGVELGQVAVLAVAVPLLALLFRRAVPERMGTVILSALVAHTAWHWLTERGATLMEYSMEWPSLDATFVAGALRALMLALIAGAAIWLLDALFSPRGRRADEPASAET